MLYLSELPSSFTKLCINNIPFVLCVCLCAVCLWMSVDSVLCEFLCCSCAQCVCVCLCMRMCVCANCTRVHACCVCMFGVLWTEGHMQVARVGMASSYTAGLQLALFGLLAVQYFLLCLIPPSAIYNLTMKTSTHCKLYDVLWCHFYGTRIVPLFAGGYQTEIAKNNTSNPFFAK